MSDLLAIGPLTMSVDWAAGFVTFHRPEGYDLDGALAFWEAETCFDGRSPEIEWHEAGPVVHMDWSALLRKMELAEIEFDVVGIVVEDYSHHPPEL